MKHEYHTIVVGSGCAGFNAADWLYTLGVTDIALITEGVKAGTSRNTGSDKQTYYKLTLAGDEPDSVGEMAQTLFDGGSMHGDTALVQAACSTKAFMKLVNLGLPFPTNKFGAYVGYKTDHDPRQRATSCGPLTSKLMTEALEDAVIKKGIQILDGYPVIKLLVQDGRARGVVVLDPDNKYQSIKCQNIILATGGPAGVYKDTVFPLGHVGASGLALDAGAEGCNLPEWQYGLASTDFRWNVSGTYQQVLPKYISIDKDGNAFEFLPDYFDDIAESLDMVFLKGYQWPFDVRKIEGSSRIDEIVAKENAKGRDVYMDFRSNPTGLDFLKLNQETYEYLEKSDSLFGTPIQRLEKMNPKAIDLYKSNGIDLYTQPLKVAVCAQHCNGGISIDTNWESSVKGLYVVGEAAGTFGVYRPGGSALNDTQVGSMRAAEHIARKFRRGEDAPTGEVKFEPPVVKYAPESNILANREAIQKRMSIYASYLRDISEMEKLHKELREIEANFFEINCIASDAELVHLYRSYDILIAQKFILSAMIFAGKEMGSRGSAFVKGAEVADDSCNNFVIMTNAEKSYLEPVRPMPVYDDWFEKVWAESN